MQKACCETPFGLRTYEWTNFVNVNANFEIQIYEWMNFVSVIVKLWMNKGSEHF
jgi:hypothetical protein